jgi:hypothetical protein
MYPLFSQPKINHLYKKGASFDQVMMLYLQRRYTYFLIIKVKYYDEYY